MIRVRLPSGKIVNLAPDAALALVRRGKAQYAWLEAATLEPTERAIMPKVKGREG